MRLIRSLTLAVLLGFAALAFLVPGAVRAAPVAASSLASQLATSTLKDKTPVYYYHRRYYRHYYYHPHYHHHYYHHYYYRPHYYHRHYYNRYYHRHYYHRHYWRRLSRRKAYPPNWRQVGIDRGGKSRTTSERLTVDAHFGSA